MSLVPLPRLRASGPALLALALGACAGGGIQRAAPPAAPPAAKPAQAPASERGANPTSARSVPSPVELDATDAMLGEVDRTLALWDAAQAEGRLPESERLAGEIRALTDANFDVLVAAARGARGQGGTYVGTMALGFARPAAATQVLVERLTEQDPRLVANALIALKLRADPATELVPIVTHLGSASADVRRYAPLALARVLEARQAAGQPVDPALEGGALRRLAGSTRDVDPLVRLHTAKALGEVRLPAAAELLLPMLDDASERVQLGAAAALARHGNRPGFERTVQLLHNVRAEAQPLVAAVLVSHAGRLQGTPLSSEEAARLSTSAPAWARWYAGFVKRSPAPR